MTLSTTTPTPTTGATAETPESAQTSPRKGSPKSGKFFNGLLPWAFLALPLAYLGVFMFWPLARQMYLSLTNTKLINPAGGKFIGLANYDRLFNDPAFYQSLQVTVVYTLLTVAFGLVLGTITALAINRPFKGRAVVRAVLLFGWAVPNVAASLVWLWMLNEQSGAFNLILRALDLTPLRWLTDVNLAFGSVLMLTIWQVTPFVMLVVLAALQSIPEEQYEAGRIDNADPLNMFRHITFPAILPALQMAGLLVAIWSIRRFDVIYLLTGGGPVGSTSTLVVKLRQVAFESHNLGLASAYGAVGLAMALMVALIHFTAEKHRNRKYGN